MAAHSMEEAETLCDRLCIMVDGSLQTAVHRHAQRGSPTPPYLGLYNLLDDRIATVMFKRRLTQRIDRVAAHS